MAGTKHAVGAWKSFWGLQLLLIGCPPYQPNNNFKAVITVQLKQLAKSVDFFNPIKNLGKDQSNV